MSNCTRCHRVFDPEKTPVLVDLLGRPMAVCNRCMDIEAWIRGKARERRAS